MELLAMVALGIGVLYGLFKLLTPGERGEPKIGEAPVATESPQGLLSQAFGSFITVQERTQASSAVLLPWDKTREFFGAKLVEFERREVLSDAERSSLDAEFARYGITPEFAQLCRDKPLPTAISPHQPKPYGLWVDQIKQLNKENTEVPVGVLQITSSAAATEAVLQYFRRQFKTA